MKILLVDDDKNIRNTLLATLESWGHEVVSASNAQAAIQLFSSEKFDFMLTDFKLGDGTGLELIRAAKNSNSAPVSVVMTAFSSFENAVNAIKEGAFDYLPKPFSNAQLELLLQKVAVLVGLRRENEQLRGASYKLDYFGGQTSPAMIRLEEFVRKIAPSDANILLIGESGTGKTELAKLIHHFSPRASKSFGVVNCSTLAENLLESELFGHMRGAFTGAVQSHIGKLEASNHGTVLIDEIGDLSLNGQAKLLHFLQEKEIVRVGDNNPLRLDVRVVAATNRNLEEAVKEKKFREDLYFRLNMFECSLVPLRFRTEDIPVLVQRFLRASLAAHGGPVDKRLPESVLTILNNYSWPGNIREMKNVLERIVLLSQGRDFLVEDLPDSIRNGQRNKAAIGQTPLCTLELMERAHIQRVLELEPNQEKASEILGITTVTLWRKRKQYGLP